MLSINNVTKKYGRDFTAVQDFSLEADKGVIGLLGPNGAGKSTLMKMLTTVSKPTKGSINWKGEDIHKKGNKLRDELGYLPQDFGVFPNLNAIEFLNYMAALKGMDVKHTNKRIEELIERLNLQDAAKRHIGGYSGGMRQRIGIAQALLNDPKILIVDEPTVGLDPYERVNFRNLITDLSEDRLVILSTHIVSDVESSASKIALMRQGELVLFEKTEQIIGRLQGKVWECTLNDHAAAEVRNQYLVSHMVRKASGVQLRILSDKQPCIQDIKSCSPTLEDAYLYYTLDHKGEENHDA